MSVSVQTTYTYPGDANTPICFSQFFSYLNDDFYTMVKVKKAKALEERWLTLYVWILLIHILGAVIGLGSSFALPVIMSRPQTVSQAKFAFQLSAGVEKLAKIGSITLLVTGLILGALSPHLFTEIWYIASIVIYIAVQPIIAGILPKKAAAQMAILEAHEGEELPEPYHILSKQMAPYNHIMHFSAVLLILFMTIKPF